MMMKPNKQEIAQLLLGKGSLFLHFDPRLDDVKVPPWLRFQPQLVLQVGYAMPIPIRDLEVDDMGVYGSLSFDRTPHVCFVPWNSVFALVGDEGRGMVWEEDLPAELREKLQEPEPQIHKNVTPVTSLEKQSKKNKDNPSQRTAVKSDRPRVTRKTLPPYLRVVK